MKEEFAAHARMVRQVMDVLEATDASHNMPFADRFIARTAADIVGALRDTPRLIHDGEVHEINGQVWRDQVSAGPSTTMWRVPTASCTTGRECRWCGSSYFADGSGSLHGLCQPCYDSGPPTS